ncbi:glycosyltransferase family 2 protein [Pseudoalteromonas sp. CH_XMU1449-3]|uniref:glycosyltransferase family 2 protein n=1 Tax=Pseudoalteromonas sp. CH_XMU1449-3 TaxID=3107774 RepID=UPI00300B2A06
MSCKISVIIPYYQHADFIISTIDSVLCQTFSSFELIVINDGSPCGMHQLLENYSLERGFKYIYQKNSGVSAAINRGILESKGKYIAIIGSDDLMYSDRLEKQFNIMESLKIDACATYVQRIDSKGRFLDQNNPAPQAFVDFGYFFSTCFYFPAPSVMYRKKSLINIGCFDENKSIEDWGAWLKLSQSGCVMYLLGEVLTKYRIHNSTTSNYVKMYSGIVDILVDYREFKVRALYLLTFNFLRYYLKSFGNGCMNKILRIYFSGLRRVLNG